MDCGGLEKGIEELNVKEGKGNLHVQEQAQGQLQITTFSELVNDVDLHFQIIRFPKQIYVWIGYNSAKLGHMYAAAPTRPSNSVSVTSILGGFCDNTGSGIAHRLAFQKIAPCLRYGLSPTHCVCVLAQRYSAPSK
ncbi:hypothetical protein LR48_Vigan213s002700 [Vigna angularis]|uniref:Uncharacterized protein n=1 Tax=Phaseolus angularis TaxID=3914 RepID=A0A0L9T7C3_PHAAN|nr:hypothetical protein LR48_Vigan213s002700 [Vigna angularis]